METAAPRIITYTLCSTTNGAETFQREFDHLRLTGVHGKFPSSAPPEFKGKDPSDYTSMRSGGGSDNGSWSSFWKFTINSSTWIPFIWPQTVLKINGFISRGFKWDLYSKVPSVEDPRIRTAFLETFFNLLIDGRNGTRRHHGNLSSPCSVPEHQIVDLKCSPKIGRAGLEAFLPSWPMLGYLPTAVASRTECWHQCCPGTCPEWIWKLPNWSSGGKWKLKLSSSPALCSFVSLTSFCVFSISAIAELSFGFSCSFRIAFSRWEIIADTSTLWK